MPLRKGFRANIPCPLWLLDPICWPATIIPLARNRQTNPVYFAKPGALPLGLNEVGQFHSARTLVRNCAIEVTGRRFELGRIGNMMFLSAEVDLPEFDTRGWINLWQGTSVDDPGTLYCALKYRPEYGQSCLCGACHASWSTHGWVCSLLD